MLFSPLEKKPGTHMDQLLRVLKYAEDPKNPHMQTEINLAANAVLTCAAISLFQENTDESEAAIKTLTGSWHKI